MVWSGERVVLAAGRSLDEVAEAGGRQLTDVVAKYQLTESPVARELSETDALTPFRLAAAGIPSNWPGDCVLTFDWEEAGSHVHFSYAKSGITGAPTIAQWRSLL